MSQLLSSWWLGMLLARPFDWQRSQLRTSSTLRMMLLQSMHLNGIVFPYENIGLSVARVSTGLVTSTYPIA